jgi:hypothetical protein
MGLLAAAELGLPMDFQAGRTTTLTLLAAPRRSGR